MGRPDLAVAERPDHEERPRLRPPHHVLEHREARRVRPLEVVQGEHERPLRPGEGAHEAPEGGREPGASLRRGQRWRRRRPAEDEVELGDELREEPRAGAGGGVEAASQARDLVLDQGGADEAGGGVDVGGGVGHEGRYRRVRSVQRCSRLFRTRAIVTRSPRTRYWITYWFEWKVT